MDGARRAAGQWAWRALWASLLPPPVLLAAGPARASGRVIEADARNYLGLLARLKPGDTLRLAPGVYGLDADGRDTGQPPGLSVFGLHGTADAPITITGPESGPRPLLVGRATHNTIRIRDASHVVLRGIDIDGRDLGGAGVATQGATHHITLENLRIRGVGGHQQHVGIRVNGGPAWGWLIRGNEIVGAGTGMYLGNSDGHAPFVAGLVEHNLVRDSIGYNVQVKHQVPWASVPEGIPTGPTTTVIRHNVFSKAGSVASATGARPNLLVGDAPPTGPGSENGFAIHGNFFWQNPTEALFQGEGRIALYANLMVNDDGPAVHIQRHNGAVRDVLVFGNTVLARDAGIAVGGGLAGTRQRVMGNAVFAATPLAIAGADASAIGNVVGSRGDAQAALAHPEGPLGAFDASPLTGQLQGPPLDASLLDEWLDARLDFDGTPRSWRTRGAYDRPGSAQRWRPRLERKP